MLLAERSRSGVTGRMVSRVNLVPLEAKLEMKDMGEAMFIVLVVVLTFAITFVWAKWNKRKRSGK